MTVVVGCDHICDIPDATIIQIQIAKVRLASVDENTEHLQDRLLRLSLSQNFHGRFDEIKLLLEVVEADSGIDPTPVQDFVIEKNGCTQTAVDVFLV